MWLLRLVCAHIRVEGKKNNGMDDGIRRQMRSSLEAVTHRASGPRYLEVEGESGEEEEEEEGTVVL